MVQPLQRAIWQHLSKFKLHVFLHLCWIDPGGAVSVSDELGSGTAWPSSSQPVHLSYTKIVFALLLKTWEYWKQANYLWIGDQWQDIHRLSITEPCRRTLLEHCPDAWHDEVCAPAWVLRTGMGACVFHARLRTPLSGRWPLLQDRMTTFWVQFFFF